MSKGLSGLFAGTTGERVATAALSAAHKADSFAKKASKQAMTNAVEGWARSEAERLETVSKSKRNEFNTASVVIDEESGAYFYGRNKGIELSGAAKNPALFGEKGILPKESLNNFPLGNCAEVDAVNKALNAGAKLKNLTMLTVYTYERRFGTPKESCENCTYAFKGKIKHNHSGWKDVE